MQERDGFYNQQQPNQHPPQPQFYPQTNGVAGYGTHSAAATANSPFPLMSSSPFSSQSSQQISQTAMAFPFGHASASVFGQGSAMTSSHATTAGHNFGANINPPDATAVLAPSSTTASITFGTSPFQQQVPQHPASIQQQQQMQMQQNDVFNGSFQFQDLDPSQGVQEYVKRNHPFGTFGNVASEAKFGPTVASGPFGSFSSIIGSDSKANLNSHPVGTKSSSSLVFSQGSNVQQARSNNTPLAPLERVSGSMHKNYRSAHLGALDRINVTSHDGNFQNPFGTVKSSNFDTLDQDQQQGSNVNVENNRSGISDTSNDVCDESHSTHTFHRNKEWVNPKSHKSISNVSASLEAHEQKARELAVLRAKLEAKKKKMMEIKLLKSQKVAAANGNGATEKKAEYEIHSKLDPRRMNHQRVEESSPVRDDEKRTDRQLRTPNSNCINSTTSAAPSELKSLVVSRDEKNKDLSRNISREYSTNRMAESDSKEILSTFAVSDLGAVSSANDSDRNSVLAARNIQRFSQAQSRVSTSMLPKELQDRAREMTSSQIPAENEEEKSANQLPVDKKHLVGTCLHMCPDEELIRREGENDIQLLELPHPEIHPHGWTLRETAIKRFRRSAADFKLDIPELVRPPHILERVCGYLEEWVMERDRQGIDPRFGQVPPALDVYQFIWDRTRMVRKDFILQNYIGTGGRCNAVAVRCHERIARWHAMCEHQLSHIPDFLSMQSQQNIQELGATMKSLNMYYDDAGGRSTVQDDQSSSSDIIHGCESSIVMGNLPIDYDGKSLRNNSEPVDLSRRIIGKKGCSGTAEPEMRGLYILLTMNNDGGMEVLKYAARLMRDRPAVFHSFPVQLALQVYKAKRENNYARFFSLLRSQSTPYLYACIMFKYVEAMRKIAFRVMSKTFGTRKKVSGEGLYDHYPLADLVHLLCFEDIDEARNACEHYNITVEKNPSQDSSGRHSEIILWRNTDFREPTDPEKRTIISLKPNKMNRVIESKLHGSTRLSICRGALSGIEATLDKSSSTEYMEKPNDVEPDVDEIQKMGQYTMIQENHELTLKPSNAKHVQATEGVNFFQDKQQDDSVIPKVPVVFDVQTLHDKNGLTEYPKLQDNEKSTDDLHHKKRNENRKRYHEAEIVYVQADESRRSKELERKNELRRKIKLDLERQREEKAAQEKLNRDLEENRRRELESRREIIIQIENQQRENLAEQARQAKEQQLKLEWQSKVEYARKMLVARKWYERFCVKQGVKMETQAYIESFDPLQRVELVSSFKKGKHVLLPSLTPTAYPVSLSAEAIFYKLATNSAAPIPFHEMLFHELLSNGIFNEMNENKLANSSKNCVLFKLGIALVGNSENIMLKNLIKMWIDQRLKLGHIWFKKDQMNEVRMVAQIIDNTICDSPKCDATLMFNLNQNTSQKIKEMDTDMLKYIIHLNEVHEPFELDSMLWKGCKSLIKNYTLKSESQLKMVERVSIRQLCCCIFRKSLPSVQGCAEKFVDQFLHALMYILENVPRLAKLNSWPYDEFVEGGTVLNYFDEEGLPKGWKASMEKSRLKEAILNTFPSLNNDMPLLIDILHDFVDKASIDVQRHCSALFNSCAYKECLEDGLKWLEYVDHHDSFQHSVYQYNIYLPLGKAKALIDLYLEQSTAAIATLLKRSDGSLDLKSEISFEEEPERYEVCENSMYEYKQQILQSDCCKRKLSPELNENNIQNKRALLESDELQNAKRFTKYLSTNYTKDRDLKLIVSDPVFSQLVESDAVLQTLVALNLEGLTNTKT